MDSFLSSQSSSSKMSKSQDLITFQFDEDAPLPAVSAPRLPSRLSQSASVYISSINGTPLLQLGLSPIPTNRPVETALVALIQRHRFRCTNVEIVTKSKFENELFAVATFDSEADARGFVQDKVLEEQGLRGVMLTLTPQQRQDSIRRNRFKSIFVSTAVDKMPSFDSNLMFDLIAETFAIQGFPVLSMTHHTQQRVLFIEFENPMHAQEAAVRLTNAIVINFRIVGGGLMTVPFGVLSHQLSITGLAVPREAEQDNLSAFLAALGAVDNSDRNSILYDRSGSAVVATYQSELEAYKALRELLRDPSRLRQYVAAGNVKIRMSLTNVLRGDHPEQFAQEVTVPAASSSASASSYGMMRPAGPQLPPPQRRVTPGAPISLPPAPPAPVCAPASQQQQQRPHHHQDGLLPTPSPQNVAILPLPTPSYQPYLPGPGRVDCCPPSSSSYLPTPPLQQQQPVHVAAPFLPPAPKPEPKQQQQYHHQPQYQQQPIVHAGVPSLPPRQQQPQPQNTRPVAAVPPLPPRQQPQAPQPMSEYELSKAQFMAMTLDDLYEQYMAVSGLAGLPANVATDKNKLVELLLQISMQDEPVQEADVMMIPAVRPAPAAVPSLPKRQQPQEQGPRAPLLPPRLEPLHDVLNSALTALLMPQCPYCPGDAMFLEQVPGTWNMDVCPQCGTRLCLWCLRDLDPVERIAEASFDEHDHHNPVRNCKLWGEKSDEEQADGRRHVISEILFKRGIDLDDPRLNAETRAILRENRFTHRHLFQLPGY